ncbi:ATP-grasp domain-containing protein [Acanthopleuribacter pedis]|uniref:ATP-grasp domain-containing protein n=1 Tax=Acanthopleuribacter pedis TaxID=442870 RepID=A0A8J7QK94_9BACT|nr:ATP-grasp domain-containing protein [Acanthopleuribacter pedis]MBO1321515.1 ATP-grasp domain-containing protein [Acanthopleuribacter pedis]
MVHVVFVAPYLLRATLQFIDGAATLPGVRLILVTQDRLAGVPASVRANLFRFHRVENVMDETQLLAAIHELRAKVGPIHRLIGTLEDLQETLARVRQTLSIDGMDPITAGNFRQKSKMKEILRGNGIPCAKHCLATNRPQLDAFIDKVGYPLVAKPPAGAGSRATFQLNHAGDLDNLLSENSLSTGKPILFEEFIMGNEYTFESAWIEGRMKWHSITRYYPSPLEVLNNSWIQWCILLPREIDHPYFNDIREIAAKANQCLGIQNGFTHLEWFRRSDGSIAVSEVAARPPGGQLTSITGFAHQFNIHQEWARSVIFNQFAEPKRCYAAGAAFLRGQGKGRVAAVQGIKKIQEELGALIVEMKLPAIGQPPGGGYEGDGYILVRHPITAVVEKALSRIITSVRVVLD